jgi:hypothetical protein
VGADELVVQPQLRWKRPYAADLSALEGTRNCACAVGAAFVAWATRDAQTPTHHEFRVAAGDPTLGGKPRGLASAEVLHAYKHFGVDASLRRGASFAEVRQALKDGQGISACIDYGFINRNAPELSGQKTFSGGHHVALLGFTSDDPRFGGANSTVVYDPLFDGRTRAWGTAPLGPQAAPLKVYRGAMGAFRLGGATYAAGHPIGDDTGIFLIVHRAPAVAAAAVGPSNREAQLAAENEQLKAQLQDALTRIAELEADPGHG